jgi:hypothetical protein
MDAAGIPRASALSTRKNLAPNRLIGIAVNWIYRQSARINATKHEDIILKAVCGPGDDAEPVITIMLPGED